jgi:hypothetical protein
VEDTQQNEKVQPMIWDELFEKFDSDFEMPEHFEGKPLAVIARDVVWEEWRKQNAAQAGLASWREWIRKALAALEREIARAMQDEWTTKCQCMAKSLSLRQSMPQLPISDRRTLYQYGIYKSNTWEEAFVRIQSTILGQIRKERARKESPWILWSETVAEDHRRKSYFTNQPKR